MACPFCESPEVKLRFESGSTVLWGDCERCGRIRATETALIVLKPEQRPFLSAFFRRIPEGEEPPILASANIDELIASLPHYTVLDRVEMLLELLAQRTSSFGAAADFDPSRDYPILISNPQELGAILSELGKRGLVQLTSSSIRLTLAGMEQVAINRRAGKQSEQAFVAMWFDPSRNPVFDEGIAPAISKARYRPLRVDRVEHVNRIDDEILAQMRHSRFLVADFVGQRPGVYFEAGFMLGLGRTVIWLAEEKAFSADPPHFDIRQFNFLLYDNPADLQTKLYNRIVAIEGEGPLSPPA